MTEPTNPSGTPTEILIVEDSPVEAEMLRRILVRAGYRVAPIAKNGEEALQALREHPCTLVMSDINMPVMNGYELCRAIKLDEKLWATPVILVTMLSEPKDIIRALDVGADGYITKPYVEDILLGRLRSLLANPARRKLVEERRRINLEYGGETHSIAVGNPQMANLMLSVYENSLILNQELMRIQNQLTVLNETLEEKVRERTAALQESEDELRLHGEIERSMAEAVSLIRVSDGVIVHTNPFFERMFGYGPSELIGKPVSIVNAPGDHGAEATANEIISSLRQNGVWNGEVHNIRKDGSTFWCHANVFTFVHPQHGQVWLAMHQDITELKQAEAQIAGQLDELKRWYDVMQGRELRVMELKREVNELLGQAGQPPRYLSVVEPSNTAAEG